MKFPSLHWSRSVLVTILVAFYAMPVILSIAAGVYQSILFVTF